MFVMYILGISCYYHDSAACLIKDGKILAAAEEERFSRKKHDNDFPSKAIKFCLNSQNITGNNLDHVIFYEKPIVRFDRILQTFVESFPHSFLYFYDTIPSWLNKKFRIKSTIRKEVGFKKDILFVDHHTSHAASTFFCSPFDEAAILTVDGVGEWATASLSRGKGNKIFRLKDLNFPNSLGLFYATLTAFLGFKVNNDEYKVMGLASYGKPTYMKKFGRLLKIFPDGSIELNLKYFNFEQGRQMWSKEMEKLLGQPRKLDDKINQRHQNIAATLQKITEDVYFKMANHLYELTKSKNLCVAGGVALNSVANGKLFDKTPFKNIFVQPASGDSGGAMGAALYAWHQIQNKKRKFPLQHAYWGPQFSQKEILKFLHKNKIKYKKLSRKQLLKIVAKSINEDKIVGWFQNAMEWGPRALGNRSILANPINPKMRDIVNDKIKHREDFRPFAGTVLQEDVNKYFEVPEKNHRSPFMLFVFKVKPEARKLIPAITHVDKTCRIQTISREQNPLYYDLIKEFKKITGVSVVLNTSFNLKGEPIVCTPEEAYNNFIKTPMDYLVLGNFLISK